MKIDMFDYYPRKVIGATADHAKQLAADIREFYRFLAESKIIRSAKFAEAIYQLRDFAGEKVELYNRFPANEDASHLYEKLFGGW